VSRAVSRLADRLLSVVAPTSSASAAWGQTYCGQCDQWRHKQWYRLCNEYGCSDWWGDYCGSC